MGMRLGQVLVVAVLTAPLIACDGEEPVRSPLTVEDLGPGDWAGPFADARQLKSPLTVDRCSTLGGFYPRSRDESLDEQEAFFGTDEVSVQVLAEQFEPDDIDPTAWEEPGPLIDRCIVAESDGPNGETTSATWRQEPDGAIVYEEDVTRGGSHTIQIALTVTDEWFVYVHMSAVEGAEAPEAIELLERAVASVEALPAPDTED